VPTQVEFPEGRSVAAEPASGLFVAISTSTVAVVAPDGHVVRECWEAGQSEQWPGRKGERLCGIFSVLTPCAVIVRMQANIERREK